MPDKKLTDNEIIKALEDWIKNYDGSYVNFKILGNSLDLIIRQKAEIERLKNAYRQCAYERDAYIEIENTSIIEAKAEAYKECIEKVKEEIAEALESNYKARAERIDKHNVGDKTDFISYCGGKIDCLRGLDDFLDNLLKEMGCNNEG